MGCVIGPVVVGVTSCESIISAKCQTGVLFPYATFPPGMNVFCLQHGHYQTGDFSCVIRLFSSSVVQVWLLLY